MLGLNNIHPTGTAASCALCIKVLHLMTNARYLLAGAVLGVWVVTTEPLEQATR